MNQRRFFGNDFFTRNLIIQRLLRYAVGTVYVLNIGFGRSPTIVFEVGFVKSDSKNCELVPTRPACCGCKLENFLSKKITVRFKLNLKTDGPDYKTIFKFGKHLERFHSTRKQMQTYIQRLHLQAMCLSIQTPFALQNTCWGAPKPLNCIVPMQAVRLHR